MKISLKAARINAGLKVEEVAKALNLTTQSIYNIENGIVKVDVRRAQRLADLYKLDINNINFF